MEDTMGTFKLYILGITSNTKKIIENLKDILKEQFKDQYCFEVIDLLENPQLAEEDNIFTTPTLLKKLPAPGRKIIGDLSNRENVLIGLNLLSNQNA